MPVDAQAAGLLDPALLQLEPNDTGACPKDTMGNPPHGRVGSLTRSLARLEEFCKREPYCLYVRLLRDSYAILEQDRRVPEHCLNASISKDICEAWTGVLLGTFSVDLLSDTEFLVYKLPKTGRGMTRDKATLFIDLIRGGYFWAGVPAEVFATSRTMPQARRDKTKTPDYRCWITMQRLAVAQARLQDMDLATQKHHQKMENPGSRGRGMIRRVDKYYAQQHGLEKEQALGKVSALPLLPPRPSSPDDYHSAQEPSEFKYDSEVTDEPKEDGDKDEEDDGDDTSICSDETSRSSGHDTDQTRYTNTANHNQKRNQRKRKESWGCCPTNARKEENKRTGKVVLLLFWDSPKEGTLTYTDWCREVEEYLRKGYDNN